MISSMELIRKIHFGGETTKGEKYDEKCYTAILKDWKNYSMEDYYSLDYDTGMFDKFYDYESMFPVIEQIVNAEEEDSFFSINSFWKREKATTEIRHLNAFALDFDFYKKDEFKNYEVKEFYDMLKAKLPFMPTAAIDSGRGLYVIYAFKHCSKSRMKLYQAIYKRFVELLSPYGMDAAATNVTQVIRIPGTCNSRSMSVVEILDFNDTQYELTDLTSILKFSHQETKKYLKQKQDIRNQKIIVSGADNRVRYSKRKQQFEKMLNDFKKLILMRNNSDEVEGYREYLLYLVRQRATWSGQTIDESIQTALSINDLLSCPLDVKDVEQQCKPSKLNRCCSIKTMIAKLNITNEEQKEMIILKSKRLKDSLYSKRSKKHKLLNRTKKEIEMLNRRTKVFHLKNAGIKNKDISDILEVNKSTITKDLRYIKENKREFRIDLTEAINTITCLIEAPKMLRSVTFNTQRKLLKWLETSQEALEPSG